MTFVSDNSCRVFAIQGPTSSSNSKNYIKPLFSERPVVLIRIISRDALEEYRQCIGGVAEQ